MSLSSTPKPLMVESTNTHPISSLERSNLSRIEANPDIPPYLAANKDRFRWMVDRDGPGANFADFFPSDVEDYRAKKVVVDAEPDFERTNSQLAFNLDNTQAGSDGSPLPPPLPPPSADWRAGSGADMPGISEENRKFLEGLKGKESNLSAEELALLGTIAATGADTSTGPVGLG